MQNDNKKLKYWSRDRLISYGRLFNMVVGVRGRGKTYNMKQYAIKDFIKNKKQFVWVRRYKKEFKNFQKFFDDIKQEFPKHKFTVKGKTAYIDGKAAGYFVVLSTSKYDKSTAFPEVNKVIFDEFIIDKGDIRYIDKEVELFLELFETIARTRDDVNAFLLANAISTNNPYFRYFKAYPKPGQRFTKVGSQVIIEMDYDESFAEEKTKTRFGQLIQGTDYYEYAVENTFLRDNDDFIEKKTKNATFEFSIKYLDKSYGIWIDYSIGRYYVSYKYNPEGESFCLTKDDHSLNTILIKNSSKFMPLEGLKESFKMGDVFFENQSVKQEMFEVLDLLRV